MLDKESLSLDLHKDAWEIRIFEKRPHGPCSQKKQAAGVPCSPVYRRRRCAASALSSQTMTISLPITGGHGHCIAKARSLTGLWRSSWARQPVTAGRSGSMHIADFSKATWAQTPIVGGGIPHRRRRRGLPLKCKTARTYPSHFSVTAHPIREPFTRLSTWQPCGNSRLSLYVKQQSIRHDGTDMAVHFVANISDRAAGYGISGLNCGRKRCRCCI